MTIGLLTQALVAIFVRHDRAQFVDPALPCAATNPSSARCARKALMIWVAGVSAHRACDAASTDPAVRPI